MEIIRTSDNGELVVEFTWNELGILSTSMIEAKLLVADEAYGSRFGLPFDSANELFQATKPTVFRYDPRLISEARPAGSREVDVVVPASAANHGPRIRMSRDELAFLAEAAQMVKDKLSAGPVGEAEYFARVGGSTDEGQKVIDGLHRLLG